MKRFTPVLALCVALGAVEFTYAQKLTLDDFSTGAYRKTLPTSNAGSDINLQKGAMIGGERETQFLACHHIPCTTAENQFGQTSGFQVRPSKKTGVPSALIFSAGYKMFPRLDVFYGVNGGITPLHLDLTRYDRLRVSYDGLNSVVNFNLELFSPTGSGILGCNLTSPTGSFPFTVDFPLKDFVGGGGGPIDLSDITLMDMISQSGGVADLGTLTFAITKFEAIPPSVPPATLSCTGH